MKNVLFQFDNSIASKNIFYYLFITVLIIFLTSICSSVAPIILKMIVDQIAKFRSMESIYYLFGIYALLMLAQRIFNEIQFIPYAWWENGIIRTVYHNIFNNLFFNRSDFFNGELHGSITGKIHQSVNGLDAIMFDVVFKIFPMFLNFLLICFSISIIFDSRMTLMVLLGVFAFIICSWVANAKIIPQQNLIRDQYLHINGCTNDYINAWKDIKLTNSHSFISEMMNKKIKIRTDLSSVFYKKRCLYGMLQSLPICFTILMCNYLALSQYVAGLATVGGILIINNYLFQLLMPLESVAMTVRGVIKSYSDYKIIHDVIGVAKESDCGGSPLLFLKELKIENVCSDGILKNINLSIKSGDKIAIFGESGAGKSTLLNILAGFNSYTGSIFLNNKKIENILELRNYTAYLHSEARLIKETIESNILLGKTADINQAVYLSGLERKISSLKDGISTIISENSTVLSRGEMQRVKLARNFILDKPIEIYDEATSGLDPVLEEEIVDNILRDKNKTVIFVTHNRNILNKFKKIYELKDFQLKEYIQ